MSLSTGIKSSYYFAHSAFVAVAVAAAAAAHHRSPLEALDLTRPLCQLGSRDYNN